ncbi:MAG: Helix-turn-helix domain [Acidimicrobiaceae bacterium]
MDPTERMLRIITQDGLVLALTPEQAAKALGISRAKMYALLKTGDVKSFHIDACRRIAVFELLRFIDERMSREAA